MQTYRLPDNVVYSEQQLLLRVADGDERAFAHLFNSYREPLTALVKRIVHTDDGKTEVLQEIFIKIWLNRDKLRAVQQLNAWLKKVAINESLLYLRKKARYDANITAIPLQGDTENQVFNHLSLKEIQEVVRQALINMPPQRRRIYHMSRIEGSSSKEIAAQLGLSQGYVRNALSAALQTIREHLPPSLYVPVIIILNFFLER